MVSTPWTRRFKSFASAALLLLAAFMLGRDGVPAAEACGWVEPSMAEMTTFDPSVAGDTNRFWLELDLYKVGVGGRCLDCERDARRSDWHGYFNGALSDADWDQALLEASVDEVSALQASLGGGQAPPRLQSIFRSVQQKPSVRGRLAEALDYVKLARQVEDVANLKPTAEPPKLALLAALSRAAARARSARDPFMLQRYRFLQLRVAFYNRSWEDVKRMVASSPELQGPSDDLAWRARHYLAGALRRSGDRAGSNLELARIFAGSKLLAGVVASDFQPLEDADWKAALQRAGDVQTQTLLWHLVGLNADGVAAAREIFELDPTSKYLVLLVVRELARAEARWEPNPAQAALLEDVAAKVAETPGADRRWLMYLASAHLAALRGDVPLTRSRVARALELHPAESKVRAQAQATLALALAHDGKTDAATLNEVAQSMLAIDTQKFDRYPTVDARVRSLVGAALAKRGRWVDAELMDPDGIQLPQGTWQSWAFLQRLGARQLHQKSAFDQLLVHAPLDLELERAHYLLLRGKLAEADRLIKASPLSAQPFVANPFVTHIKDCLECDYGAGQPSGKPWTLGSVSTHLRQLEAQARGSGDAAARASLELGTALYNFTLLGNARPLTKETHQATLGNSAALVWYERAHGQAKNRELKAQAAYLAAKAERGQLADQRPNGDLPIPSKWFGVVQTYADTAYHREVLAECGTYRAWHVRH